MFGTNDIEKALGVKITATTTMQERIAKWSRMLSGQADWCDETVHSMRLESGIVREFANIAVSEMTSSVSVPALDALYQTAIKKLAQRMQAGLATGAMCIKPLPDGNVQYIPQSAFIPIRYDAAGRLVEVVFPETIHDGELYYTRLEWHDLTPDGLTIINRAYVSHNEDTLGQETALSVRDEWAHIMPEAHYAGVNRPVFGYYVNPIENTIDGSYMGVSVYDAAADKIRQTDVQFGRLDWEFESGERAVHVDDMALKARKDKDGKVHRDVERLNKRLYRGLNVMPGADKELFEVFSPEFRDASLINGLEEYKREIEFVVGLAYGDISNPASVEKTATEVIAAKKRKYDTVTAIQSNLRDCLDDLVYALAFYNALTLSGYEFICDFKDSILVDEETERSHDMQMVSMGVMSLAEFRSKWMGEPLDVAEKNLPQPAAVLE